MVLLHTFVGTLASDLLRVALDKQGVLESEVARLHRDRAHIVRRSSA